MRIVCIFLAFLTFSCQTQKSECPSPAGAGATGQIEADVRFLADDLLEGRATPSRGLEISSLYLAEQLRAAGVEPGNDGSYFQEYDVESYDRKSARVSVKVDGVEMNPAAYVTWTKDPIPEPKKFKLVMTGYGIYAPERDVDDYAGLDIAGKAVIQLLGAPWKTDPEAVLSFDRAFGKWASLLVKAAAVQVYVTDEFDADPPTEEMKAIRSDTGAPCSLLAEAKIGEPWAIVMSPAEFNRLLAKPAGGTNAELSKKLAAGEKINRELEAHLELQMQAEIKKGKARNVIGIIRGQDPELRDEWVLVSAHYDHLFRGCQPKDPDQICNGADDNASGSAAVLHAARRLAAGPATRRSVMFLLTSGEEQGWLGALHFAANPTVPLDKIIVSLNVDMIGRSDGKLQCLSNVSPDILEAAAKLGPAHQLEVVGDLNPSLRLVYFSDNYPFARRKIPSTQFHTGLHDDYHKPSDEVDRIRFKELARACDLIADLAAHYAQGGQPPRWQPPKWFVPF